MYMNGIALVRPFKSDIFLFVQNILYFSPFELSEDKRED